MQLHAHVRAGGRKSAYALPSHVPVRIRTHYEIRAFCGS